MWLPPDEVVRGPSDVETVLGSRWCWETVESGARSNGGCGRWTSTPVLQEAKRAANWTPRADGPTRMPGGLVAARPPLPRAMQPSRDDQKTHALSWSCQSPKATELFVGTLYPARLTNPTKCLCVDFDISSAAIALPKRAPPLHASRQSPARQPQPLAAAELL